MNHDHLGSKSFFWNLNVYLFITKGSSSKDEAKPAEGTEKHEHDELFDAIASLFPDKGLLGSEVYRR